MEIRVIEKSVNKNAARTIAKPVIVKILEEEIMKDSALPIFSLGCLYQQHIQGNK